jgi:nitrogen fixation/metabolism regulation signal transduction histidine kinase
MTKEKALSYTETINKQIKYMSNTIDDFRDFFVPDKIEKEFGVKEAISEVFELLSYQLKNHSVAFSISGDDFRVKAHKNEFKQVILNIINNSTKTIYIDESSFGQKI